MKAVVFFMKLEDFSNIMRQVNIEHIKEVYLMRKALLSGQIETDNRVTNERYAILN